MKYPITCSEKYDPAMRIMTRMEADSYLEECVQHNLAYSTNNRARAEEIEKSNLAYWAGYYDKETRIRVERLFNCTHPVLGKAEERDWSPDELVQKGIETAREWAKKSGNTPDHASNESVKG